MEHAQKNLLDAIVVIPGHVVYRDFASETVLLNIETGTYHGLNPVAGRMLETLDRVGRVRDAIPMLAAEFEQPIDVIERDLAALCDGLLQRGLLEVRPAADGLPARPRAKGASEPRRALEQPGIRRRSHAQLPRPRVPAART